MKKSCLSKISYFRFFEGNKGFVERMSDNIENSGEGLINLESE